MWKSIQTWYKSHTLTTHSLVGAFLTLSTLYTAVPAFQQLVNNMYSKTPTWFHTLAMAVVGIITYYNLANKKETVRMAEVAQVQAQYQKQSKEAWKPVSSK